MKATIIMLSFLRFLKRTSSEMEGFIVGGDYAEIKDHPHSAYLSISCDRVHTIENFACGGSILNHIMVLTAAHCLEECRKSTRIKVSVGSKKKSGILYYARKFSIHERYDIQNLDNDIALIMLKNHLEFSKTVKRVAVLKNRPQIDQAMLAGWGLVDEEYVTHTNYLKEAKQKILSEKQCIRLLGKIPRGTLCTTSGYRSKSGHGARGDSGSALIVKNYIQVGLVSYKNPQITKKIVVFTDVSYHYNWLKTTVYKFYNSCRRKK